MKKLRAQRDLLRDALGDLEGELKKIIDERTKAVIFDMKEISYISSIGIKVMIETKKILEERGITVDILPATVPPKYWADAFISIHADGSESALTTGYKAASPRRDFSGNAEELVKFIVLAYEEATGLVKDPNITRNMTGYYAFAWWRYEHAVHPMTAAAILETGFLTNPSDRRIIVNKPEVSAEGLANGIIKFLESEKLLGKK